MRKNKDTSNSANVERSSSPKFGNFLLKGSNIGFIKAAKKVFNIYARRFFKVNISNANKVSTIQYVITIKYTKSHNTLATTKHGTRITLVIRPPH